MKIISIIIIGSEGFSDNVTVTTDLPSTMPKLDNTPMYFSFRVERDKGEAYCKQHFPGTPIEIIKS